jgi:D-alanine-D-alanine ligase
VVRSAEQLPEALVGAFAYGSVVLVEHFVEGIELAVSVVETGDGPRVLPAVEIAFPGDVFDYEARYTAGMTTYYTPARLTPEAAAAAATLALAAHENLGLRDMSRTDMIVDADGAAHFLEVNVSPGLTETSMFPMAVGAAGFDLGALYSELIERAIERFVR